MVKELLVVRMSRPFAAKPAANRVKTIQSVINSKLINGVLIMHKWTETVVFS